MTKENDGHRERMRQRVLQNGAGSLQDHELLEMLLFGAVPRKDTNKLAHQLITAFGSLNNVLKAEPHQLMLVRGVSKGIVCHIAVARELLYRFKREINTKRNFAEMTSILDFARELAEDCYTEKMVVVYVDTETDFLFMDCYSSNRTAEVYMDVPRIVSNTVRLNAAGVILFHSHVGGNCNPSAADRTLTEKLYITLANMNVMILDHIVFNDKGEFYSFFKSGDIAEMAERYNKMMSNIRRQSKKKI